MSRAHDTYGDVTAHDSFGKEGECIRPGKSCATTSTVELPTGAEEDKSYGLTRLVVVQGAEATLVTRWG